MTILDSVSVANLTVYLVQLPRSRTALRKQGIDTSETSPVAQLQLHLLGAFAEFEKSLIVERVNAGLKAARQRGVVLGRPSKNDKHLPRVIELLRQNRCNQVIMRELGLPRSSAGELVREAKAMMAQCDELSRTC